jgi:PKD repeat protein
LNWRTAVLATLLSLAIIHSLSLGFDTALAQRIPGVAVGQWIRYGRFLALWDSEVPGASPTLDLYDVNNTDWVTHTVQNVSGTVVTFEILTHYKNGNETSSIADVNVETGTGRGNMSFVTAGISAGNRVYTSGELYDARVNSTSLRSYAGVFRETSLLNVTQTSIGFNASSAYWTEFFWDKLTGVLVRQFWSMAYDDEDDYLTLASIEYELADTNIWLGVPDTIVPTAIAGSDMTVEAGANVTFDGGSSRDNVGITSFTWDFGDGSSGNGLQAFHIYDRVGAYNVTLTVEDVGGNGSSDVLVVTVKEAAVAGPSQWLVPVAVSVLVVFLVLAWFLLKRRARPRVRRKERQKHIVRIF